MELPKVVVIAMRNRWLRGDYETVRKIKVLWDMIMEQELANSMHSGLIVSLTGSMESWFTERTGKCMDCHKEGMVYHCTGCTAWFCRECIKRHEG